MTETTDATDTTGDLLTRNELEVLSLIADGFSTPMIAQKLNRNARAVKTDIQRLCRKLGATGRANAVALGFIKDLLPLRWERE